MATLVSDLPVYPDNSSKARAESSAANATDSNALHSREGRIGVLSHSARTLLAFVIIFCSLIPLMVILIPLDENTTTAGQGIAVIAASVLTLVGSIYGMWLGIVSSVKRLHDLNKSGWFYLLFLIPVIGTFYYLFVSLKRGDETDNKFGKPSVISSREKIAGYVGMGFILMTVAFTIISSLADIQSILGA